MHHERMPLHSCPQFVWTGPGRAAQGVLSNGTTRNRRRMAAPQSRKFGKRIAGQHQLERWLKLEQIFSHEPRADSVGAGQGFDFRASSQERPSSVSEAVTSRAPAKLSYLS